MRFQKIVIVPKESKVEWDMRTMGVSLCTLKRRYAREGVDAARIFESHARQQASLAKLVALLGSRARIVTGVQLKRKGARVLRGADLVIAHGGDNSLQFVAQYLTTTPLLALNSDPTSSEGALTSGSVDDFARVYRAGRLERAHIERWMRPVVYVNGKRVGLALSEIFIGARERIFTSRHVIEAAGKREEQKSSGVIVTTGAGSTGWYLSAVGDERKTFARDAREARFVVTEPYRGKLTRYSLVSGTIRRTQKLTLHSLNSRGGLVALDAERVVAFDRGSIAVIKLSDTPLRVLTLT